MSPASRRILLVSFDAIGAHRGGAAIRVLGLAHGLQEWNHSPTIVTAQSESRAGLERAVAEADVAVLPLHALKRLPFLRRARTPLVFDIYDPVLFELMETNATPDLESHYELLHQVLRRGDFFLCASERQRDFWLGALLGNRRSLSGLIEIVPFGIDPSPSPAPKNTRQNLAAAIPAIARAEKVVVWPGGIWDWTDPQTLLAAMRILERDSPGIHLVFFAGKHPGSDHAETAAARATRALAGDNVHFIDDYIAYDRRGDYLAECDAAVSTHRRSLESHFAYRARFLDCIWAGLPIICTEGDLFSELVVRRGFGLTVPAENPEALASAIAQLATDNELAASCRLRLIESRAAFNWKDAVAPLARYCLAPTITHVSTPVADARMLAASGWRVLKSHGLNEAGRRLRRHFRG